jgi:glutamate racemase
MSDARAIGVIDSGLGGLAVVREMRRLLPHERFVYLGDLARFPYGDHSAGLLRRYGWELANFVAAQNIKMLVVACNSLASASLDYLRDRLPELPVIAGVLPSCRAAVLRTAEKKIGIIATRATIHTALHRQIILQMDGEMKVYAHACPLLVPIVEEGLADSPLSRAVVQHYLYELVDIGIDCLILASNHYSQLMEVVQETVGTRIELLDCALWTAKEAYDILSHLNAVAPNPPAEGSADIFYFTDALQGLEERAARFLAAPLTRVETVEPAQLAIL